MVSVPELFGIVNNVMVKEGEQSQIQHQQLSSRQMDFHKFVLPSYREHTHTHTHMNPHC